MMEIGNHHITTLTEIIDSDKDLQKILKLLNKKLLRRKLFS